MKDNNTRVSRHSYRTVISIKEKIIRILIDTTASERSSCRWAECGYTDHACMHVHKHILGTVNQNLFGSNQACTR